MESTTPPSDAPASIRIVYPFKVKPQVVFDAFTKPEAMKVWWTETTEFDIDLQIGGNWTITRTAGENVYVAKGKYIEIDPPNRLKYSYAMPQFSPNTDTITIDIVPDGAGGAILTYEVAGKDTASELAELKEGEVSQSEQGWRMGFDMMAAAWEGKKE